MTFEQRMYETSRKVERWARPGLYIFSYWIGIEDLKEALKGFDRDDIKSLVAGTLNRMDPYKAPEQVAMNVDAIGDFLWEELHP